MQHKKSTGPSPNQHRMIEEALALHQSGQLDAAEIHYKKLLQYLPSNTMLLSNLGAIALQKGHLADALKIITRSLQCNPKQAYALNNLGSTLKDLKRLDEALDSYERAIALEPGFADAYSNRGNVLLELKRLDDALDSYERAIALNPYYANAYCNQGVALKELKRPHEALDSFERAIALKPDYAEAYYNRGSVLQELKRLDEALASYEQSIALKTDDAEVYYNRGITLQKLKRIEQALASYEQAIRHKADYAEAYCNRGLALQKLNRLDEALDSYDHAIALNPDSAEAYYNRGIALQKLKRVEEALVSFERAITLKPDYAAAYTNRGNALQKLNRLDEALASHEQAIMLKPNSAGAYSNRGSVLQELKRLDEALACYEQAIVLKPNSARAYWNKSLLKIINGEYIEGWQLYEWRWKAVFRTSLRSFTQPLWLGHESLSSKTMVIYPEQGLGDYIQCIRYAALVEQLGATVILEVPLALLTLISTLKGQFTLVESGQALPEFDYHCPVMSLPLAFKTTLENIPAQFPYLSADKNKKQQWHDRLGQKLSPRIGLVWSGSSVHKNDHNRSLLLKQLAGLLTLPLEFHALQKEVRAIDVDTLIDFPNIHQHQNDLLDFSDTAALIEAMDIIISVDTSVAHLAGAMGKKVLVLLPYSPDYRWLLKRTDSPWYPTATLFRQPAIDDWESVVESIRIYLEQFIENDGILDR